MHCAVDCFARLVSRKNWPLFMDVQNKRTENASMEQEGRDMSECVVRMEMPRGYKG